MMLQTAGEEAHPQLQLQQELLPYEALVCMLQYVDLPTRLTSCALVCSTWAAAAVKATYAVHLRDVTEQRLTSLLRWLRRSRACLNAVSLHHDAADPLMLQLWDLIDALHEPHGLLQLSVCNVLCLAGSLTALNRCDRLQRLELLSVTAPEGLSPLVFPGTLLLDLPHLTALHLGPGLLIDSGSLQHLGSLKGLQQLQIHGCQHLSAEDLAPIASLRQLKYLALAGVPRLPELQRLTGLRHLALTACQEGLQPTVLSALTGLQQLDLADTCVQGHDLGLGTQQLMLANKAAAGQPSDLLGQLVTICTQKGVDMPGSTAQQLEEGVQQLQLAAPAPAAPLSGGFVQPRGRRHAARHRGKCRMQ